LSELSFRTILRSASITGGAQVITIAVGLLKMKVVAVLLGPAGVGLIGLYLSLVQAASSIAAMGLGNVGTRQIAQAHAEGGDVRVGRTRQALFWGTMAFALIGAGLFWLASDWIARIILADEARTKDVALLSLGVALTVAAGSQGALLSGLRRIGDLARVNVGAGAIGAILGVLAVWIWGDKGLIATVIVVPLATFLLGHLYVVRLGTPAGPLGGLTELSRELRVMVRLGFAFMLSGVFTTLGHLVARTLVQRELGAEALGQFQAAWVIGMTYLGFALSAMATDYYPRLTIAIHDFTTATRIVNEQTEVALLLSAPVLMAMLGLAPWVIHLLYSSEFSPAVEILRWQLLGDLLKVLSWPLSFVFLASGAGKTFILTEFLGMGVFVVGILIGLPLIGVTATGVAFLAMYLVYLPLVWVLGVRMIGFRWTKAVKVQALVFMAAAVAVDIAGRSSEQLGAFLGICMALATGFWALMKLSAMTKAKGRLAKLALIEEKVTGWMVR
jgi:O-antigen/teichoic acid export membrane protein